MDTNKDGTAKPFDAAHGWAKTVDSWKRYRAPKRRVPQKRIAEKLRERLYKEGFEVTGEPERLYHGHHQRSAGAWSWKAPIGHGCELGSALPMRELLELKSEDFAKWIE